MTSTTVDVQDLTVGATAPVVEHRLTRTDLVRYAGASGDYNPMHHDEIKAQKAKMPSVFGHGMLSMAIVGRAVTDWVGVGALRTFGVRFTGQTWPGNTLSTHVEVTDVADGSATLSVALRNDEGKDVVTGTATVGAGPDLRGFTPAHAAADGPADLPADAPDEAEAYKGIALPTQVVTVERGAVANFALAVTDTSPVFTTPAAAAEQGFGAIPTPPTWSFVMHNWGAHPENQPKGQDGINAVNAVIGTLMRTGGMLLHGEQEFSYSRPVLVGETLVSRGSIRDVYRKETSSGTVMTFIVAATDWLDADGEVVATNVMNLIHRK